LIHFKTFGNNLDFQQIALDYKHFLLFAAENVSVISSYEILSSESYSILRSSGIAKERTGIAFPTNCIPTFDEFMLSPSYLPSSFSQLVFQFVYIPETVICNHIIFTF